jgi:hypothetical protein
MKPISIIKAEYVSGYKVKISFNEGTVRTVDFADFFSNNSHPQYDKYKKSSLFKQFKVVMGNIVWGKNWDIVFPVYDLYKGEI